MTAHSIPILSELKMSFFDPYAGAETRSLQCISKKNIPDIFSCNFRKHCRIFIMFGTHVTEKVSNQQLL